MATCPKCDAEVKKVTVTPVKGDGGNITTNCIAYSCGECDAVLSVMLDPLRVKGDIVQEVVTNVIARLGPLLRR